jgi:hypothetical protein
MLGLVKHDVVRARYGHDDHESVPVILNFAAKLRSFALQFSDRVCDVVAHQGDQMVPRRFVRLAIVDTVGRVHAHLTPPGLEDQPTRASTRRILDVGPAEDVAKECARCGGIVRINQGVDAGDHQTELLKSPKFYYFGLLPIKPFLVTLGEFVRNPEIIAYWRLWTYTHRSIPRGPRCVSNFGGA